MDGDYCWADGKSVSTYDRSTIAIIVTAGQFYKWTCCSFLNDKGMTILYHQHSGCDHYGCWSQGLRRGKSSFLIFKITEEMSDDQTRWHRTFCHLISFMRWPWIMKSGRHCYCPDLFLSASDIARTGAQKNPGDKLSASDMRYNCLMTSLLLMSHLFVFLANI